MGGYPGGHLGLGARTALRVKHRTEVAEATEEELVNWSGALNELSLFLLPP
jgi:hypothetical protein